MQRYAILDSEGNVLNTIIYDGVAKYKVDTGKVLKDIEDIKYKHAEPGDKIVSDILEKKIKIIIDSDVVIK